MRPNRFTLTLLFIASALLLNFVPTSNSASATETWRVPVDSPTLAKEFRQPSSDWSSGHRGVDYLVQGKQSVFSAHAGLVTFTGRVVNRSVVSIRHGNGYTTSYEPVCSDLQTHSMVETGQVIGEVCAEPQYQSHCGLRLCLHFSLRSPNGYLSPLAVIGGLSPSRLKPWDGLRCNPLSSVQC